MKVGWRSLEQVAWSDCGPVVGCASRVTMKDQGRPLGVAKVSEGLKRAEGLRGLVLVPTLVLTLGPREERRTL